MYVYIVTRGKRVLGAKNSLTLAEQLAREELGEMTLVALGTNGTFGIVINDHVAGYITRCYVD